MNLLKLLMTNNASGLLLIMLKRLITIFVYILIIGLTFYFFNKISINCVIPPKKSNYDSPECYQFVDCLYRTGNDKSICSIFAESCKDSFLEMRHIQRIEYCKNNKPADMSERECRLWINQK